MTLMSSEITTESFRYAHAVPAHEFRLTLPFGVSVAFYEEERLQGMAMAQLRVLSPCCTAVVTAREKDKETSSYFSRAWSCTACGYNFGDQHWRITLLRSLDSEEEESPLWKVVDLGVLQSLLDESYNVLDATMMSIDLIALLEEIFNWISDKHDFTVTQHLFKSAQEHFKGRELWTPMAT